MSRRTAGALLVISLLFAVSVPAVTAQNTPQETNSARKVLTRVFPDCPALARKMHIQGVVKLEAVVRPNGSVKSTRVIGGNPVLVEAASNAVVKWKFEASSNETTELVQVTFVAP